MNIMEFYEAVLHTAWMTTNNDGFIRYRTLEDGQGEQVLIEGKALVAGTRKQLSTPDMSNRMLFNPISESAIKGESAIIRRLTRNINERISESVFGIIYALLTLSASPKHHAGLTPTQSEVLSVLKGADEKTLEAFTKLSLSRFKVGADKANLYVKTYLRKSATLNGEIYSRAGIVIFPIFEELLEAKNTKNWTVNGVNLGSKKNVELFIKAHQYVFPAIESKNAYDVGSNSDVAPYLDSLLATTSGLINHINKVADLFEDYIKQVASEEFVKIRIEKEWEDKVGKLHEYLAASRTLPSTSYNEGDISVKEKIEERDSVNIKTEEVTTVSNVEKPTVTEEPVRNTRRAPVVEDEGEGLDYRAYMSRNNSPFSNTNNSRSYSVDNNSRSNDSNLPW